MLAVAKKTSGWPLLLLVLFLGLVLGTILGEIGARLVPTGSLHRFFETHVEVGWTEPLVCDLRALRLAFGLALKVNILGLLGLIGAGLAWFRLSH